MGNVRFWREKELNHGGHGETEKNHEGSKDFTTGCTGDTGWTRLPPMLAAVADRFALIAGRFSLSDFGSSSLQGLREKAKALPRRTRRDTEKSMKASKGFTTEDTERHGEKPRREQRINHRVHRVQRSGCTGDTGARTQGHRDTGTQGKENRGMPRGPRIFWEEVAKNCPRLPWRAGIG